MQSKFKSKPIAAAVAAMVATGFLVACGGGGGGVAAAGGGGVGLGGVVLQGLLDKAPFNVICVADGSLLGSGTAALGVYSITIDPAKCAGQVLIELDVTKVPTAGLASAGPDNIFGTSDDEIYKPSERMPLKAISDLTGAKVGDSVTANLSAVTTGVADSALTAAGVDTISATSDIKTQLKELDAKTTPNLVAATANIATALGLTQTTADYTKIDPRTNSELAEKGTLLSAAVYAAVKGTPGKTAQAVINAIVTNLNKVGDAPAAANGDITKLSTDVAFTKAITQAKTMIDAEAKVRKDMVDSLQLLGITKVADIPATKAAMDTLLAAKKADTTATVSGTTTKVADVAAVYQQRQQEGAVIAAAQTYLQTPPAVGTNANAELAKVTGIVNAFLAKVGGAAGFTSSTANTAAQQEVFKNAVAVVNKTIETANSATPGTLPTAMGMDSDLVKISIATKQIVDEAVKGTGTIGSVFAPPPAVGSTPVTFDPTTIANTVQTVVTSQVKKDEVDAAVPPVFTPPPVPGSGGTGTVNLDAAKILDPGAIAFTTTTKSAVAATDVLESDEITVPLINTPIPVVASGEGVTLVITNLSGVVTKLEAAKATPFKTPVGFVLKGDKVKLLVKSPAVAQTPNKVEVVATLSLLGKTAVTDTTATATRTATLTVQGPAGVVPGAPTISGVTVSDGSATVTLTAPTSAGSADITEYEVTATPVGTGSPVTQKVIGTVTSVTLANLVNGTEYTFTVTAKNGVGVSTASASSGKFTPAKGPDAPAIGSATAGNASAVVTFSAPASDGGSAITGYTVTSNPAGGVDSDAGKTSLSHTITGLVNGTAYTFTVVAANAKASGTISAATTPVTPVGPASAPTSVVATAGNSQATVTFAAPANTGGAAVTGYTVVSSPVGGVDSNAGTTGLSHVITGLTNGTAYTFTVKATTSAGEGAASVASTAVTPATVPAAPSAVTAAAGNGSASVTFTAPSTTGGSAITGYTVVSSPAGGVDSNAGTTGLSHVITGLTNGTAYTFTVVATNAKGPSVASGASSSVTPATVAGAPTSVAAVAGNATATVTFAAPTDSGGNAVTGYTVISSPAGGVDSNAGTTGLSHVITGLTNGTAYTFTVKATTSAGQGAASAASTAVTPATVPGAPAIGTVTGGNATATVAFTAPSSTGGSAITGYTVISSPAGGVDSNAGTIGLSHVITGLTNGTAYTFTVVATNAKGAGTASGVSSSVTPTVPSLFTTATTGTLADGKGLFQKLITAGTAVTFTYTVSGVGTTALPFTVSSGVTGVKVNGVLVDTTDATSAIAKDGDSITLKGTAPTTAFDGFAGSISFGTGKPTGWIGVCSGASTAFGTPPSVPAGSPFPSTCPQS